ncbi:hypothetical protein N7513_000011 [Penicillium frequentans]|nr:hypothetical protein N7513_004674 [Penicillium glabrum]KAJ5563769.1 hypothetical protein N7513_000011 [Penicillium glabrum]
MPHLIPRVEIPSHAAHRSGSQESPTSNQKIPQSIVNKAQELELEFGRRGFPLSNKKRFADTAEAVSEAVNKKQCLPLGGCWGGRTMAKDPDFEAEWDALKDQTSKSRSPYPPKDFLDEQKRELKKFPKKLRNFMKDKAITPENVFFLSNRGYRLYIDKDTTTTSISCPEKKKPRPTAEASVLYCLPHKGKPFAPFFTFQCKNGGPPYSHEGLHIVNSSDGWISESDFFTWRQKIFGEHPKLLSQASERKEPVPRLLLFDGVKIPMNKKFFVSAEMEENIFCLALPRGMSSMFTPLEDRLVSIDHKYQQVMENAFRGSREGYRMEKSIFVQLIANRLNEAPDGQKVWKKLGLIPCKSGRFGEHIDTLFLSMATKKSPPQNSAPRPARSYPSPSSSEPNGSSPLSRQSRRRTAVAPGPETSDVESFEEDPSNDPDFQGELGIDIESTVPSEDEDEEVEIADDLGPVIDSSPVVDSDPVVDPGPAVDTEHKLTLLSYLITAFSNETSRRDRELSRNLSLCHRIGFDPFQELSDFLH